MPRQDKVPRPTKAQEYEIYFASSQAEKGWQDLKATTANALADCWDALTKDPLRNDQQCHPLRDDLGTVTVKGTKHVRRQYELPGGARIWYYVTESKPKSVYLLDVHTRHPNQTK